MNMKNLYLCSQIDRYEILLSFFLILFYVFIGGSTGHEDTG